MSNGQGPRIMSVDAAKELINSHQALARRYQAAFHASHAETRSLAEELGRILHDDFGGDRFLSPAASLAFASLKAKGKWPGVDLMARDAANRAISEFLRNPLNWGFHEALGSYLRRALDFRALDCLREEYPHLNGRARNEYGIDPEGDATGIIDSHADTRHGHESDADAVLERVEGIINRMPYPQKVIATENLLKADGLSGKDLAALFRKSEGWVSGLLTNAKETIRQELSMGA